MAVAQQIKSPAQMDHNFTSASSFYSFPFTEPWHTGVHTGRAADHFARVSAAVSADALLRSEAAQAEVARLPKVHADLFRHHLLCGDRSRPVRQRRSAQWGAADLRLGPQDRAADTERAESGKCGMSERKGFLLLLFVRSMPCIRLEMHAWFERHHQRS